MSPSPELPPPSPPIACEPRNCFYNVTEGDTLITVAKRFNVSTRRLIAMNPDIILPETLRVCLDSANSTEPCTYSPKGELRCVLCLAWSVCAQLSVLGGL